MPAQQPRPLTNSEPDAPRGSVTPRLWTPPLRDLTSETSYGFDVIDFARDVVGIELDSWQQWVMIHAGELLPDGRPRFRVALIIVARQNGKTLLSKILTLYWMFVEQHPLILSTSATLSYAKESWISVIQMAKDNPYLKAELGPRAVRASIGEEEFRTLAGSRYKIAAANRRAGRSLTVHRLILDELREHHSWDTWNAAVHAMNAVPGGQVVAISNMGDDTSVVLDSLRSAAIEFIESGVGDPRLGLFEYSAPPGSDPSDVAALAMANPSLGDRVDPDALLGAAARAKAAGGLELAGHLTEVMCMRVSKLDSAIDPTAWAACASTTPLDLAEHRDKVALCLDVSLSGDHATLVAAAVVDGVVHVEVVAAWAGFGCTKALRADLPDLIREIRPRAFGWFPAGPAAAVAADLADRGSRDWPPRRVVVEEIRGDTAAACMSLAEQISTKDLRHPDDPLLNQHTANAGRLWRGDSWVYQRRGASAIDGVYALAGAVQLARTLPPGPPALVAL